MKTPTEPKRMKLSAYYFPWIEVQIEYWRKYGWELVELRKPRWMEDYILIAPEVIAEMELKEDTNEQ